MAYVIDRTTKEISTRDTVSAMADPSVLVYWKREVPPEVIAAEPWYRVIDGDDVRLATEAERRAIDADRQSAAFAEDLATRLAKIDARTRELVTDGCEVAPGVVISTSEAAQLNFYGMMAKRALGLPFVPQAVSTVDHLTYVIRDDADLVRVGELLDAAIKGPQMTGQQLRLRLLAAVTAEERDAVKDDR